MKTNIILLAVSSMLFYTCATSTYNDKVTDRMKEIRQILIGDWIEDSLEFKRVYNMPPPPVQNTRVRYQEDGYVYIPDVLLTKEQWDTWEIANDSTLHIIKRQGYGTRVFLIDSITKNMVKYRLQIPPHERKIKLLKIK
ncbi:hypothetical protein OAK19_02475 [Aureispira]|nr:hypothetical protein [Aureispira sp.]